MQDEVLIEGLRLQLATIDTLLILRHQISDIERHVAKVLGSNDLVFVALFKDIDAHTYEHFAPTEAHIWRDVSRFLNHRVA